MTTAHFGYHQIQCKVVNETENAICFNVGKSWIHEGNNIWIPKSQMLIETESAVNDYGVKSEWNVYYVKEWLWKKYNF